NLVPMVAAV
nr:Chain P, HCMV pp65 fragment 495-503, variant T8A (NLVPMVAAV) [synthetic construct]